MTEGLSLVPPDHGQVYTILLPAACAAQLRKTAARLALSPNRGGWQGLARDLSAALHGDELTLSEEFVHRLIPTAGSRYRGGFQDLIRWIVCLWLEQYRLEVLRKG